MRAARLSLRITGGNPLHHLWNNHGVWWIHYTLETLDGRVRRVRRSLRTQRRDEAILLRDALLAHLAQPTAAVRS